MSVKKIESLNKHENPATNTNPFNLQVYVNDNWDTVMDVVNNNADELETAEQDISEIKQEQTTQNENITKNASDIKDIQDKNVSQDEVIANINERDTAQDTSIEVLQQRLKEKDEQIAELEDKVVDLNNNQIHGQASGEYVHLVDSANMNCGITILGNSEQETGDITDEEGNVIGNMPSTGYPSEIKSCGDNVNLLNARYGIDITASDSYKIEVLAETEYTLSLTQKLIELGDKTAVQHQIRYYNENDENISSSGIMPFVFTSVGETQSGVRTITTPASCKYVILDLGTYFGSGSSTIQNVQAKFEKGSVATPYSPYGQGCINEVINNENIALKDLNTTASSASTFVYIDKIAKVKKGKRYYVSLSGDETFGNISGNNMHFRYQSDTNDNLYGWIQGINFSKGKYIECEYDAFIGIRVSGHLKYSDLIVSLEEIADYIPHQEQNYPIPTQQPFRSIGDTRDTFIKKDGKRYERHNIARKIFDGTENLIYTANTGNRYAYSITLNGKIKGQHSKEYLSNMYKQKPEGSWTSDGIISVSATSYNTYIFITGLATTSDVKAWLKELYDAGTPLCIDYILETPLDIECTPEQNEILDKLEKAKTYKNITNIFSTDEVSAIIDVDYKRDLETILNNMQQAILSQGGNV